eukprot:296204-Pyramimonas_sp.AAC.1
MGERMWTPPLRPSAEVPIGPRSAARVGGDACGHRHRGIRWSPLMGPRNAALGGGDARGHRHWGI